MSRRFVCRLNQSAHHTAYAFSRIIAFILCPLLCLIFNAGGHASRMDAFDEATSVPGEAAAVELLRVGVPVARRIGKGGCDVYAINLTSGQYLQLLIDKEADLALLITLYRPDGGKVIEQVSRRYGPLHVSTLVEVSGTHRLEIRSLEKDSPDRRYEVRIEELRSAAGGDGKYASASRALADAETLRSEWEAESLQKAIESYAAALGHWQSSHSHREAAQALRSIGEVHFILSEYDSALDFFRKARVESVAAHDPAGEVEALNDIAYVYINQGRNLKALTYCNLALAFGGQVPPAEGRRLEAQAVNNMGEVYYSLGDLKKALKLFSEALKQWAAAADRKGQALAHLNLGYTFYDMGDMQASSDHYEQSLSLWQEIGDRRGEALSRTALGGVYAFRGERQAALDAHEQAAQAFRVIGDHQGEASALNGVGRIYEELNQPETALDNYDRALRLYQQVGNRDFEALTECYVGRVRAAMGDRPRAFDSYRRSVVISRSVGDQRVEAYALQGIGQSYINAGERRKAVALYEEVLQLYRKAGDRHGQAQALKSIGVISHLAGRRRKALGFYRQSLTLYQAAGDLKGEAAARYSIAREARDCHLLDEALSEIRASINTIEALRTRISSYELRASYFALVHEYYGFYIDLLMEMQGQRPGENFAALALQASESSRSRSLLELLVEAKADIRQGVPADLLERERSLQQMLSARAKYEMRLMANPRTEGEAAEVTPEVRQLAAEYDEVQTRIREQSPRYAALTHPQLLSLEEIQSKLLDEDTVLIEYALGEEKSYLWVVTPNSLESHELPPRSEIETEVREVYGLLTARQQAASESPADYQKRISESDEQYWRRASALSNVLVGPVAAKIADKRLLIVADGALQYIPFEALPSPGTSDAAAGQSGAGGLTGEPTPLVLTHEIISLPSASTLASLREEEARRVPGSKTIAILADPVFERDDPRVRLADGAAEAVAGGESAVGGARPFLRDFDAWADGRSIARLPSTLHEAQAIVNDTSRDECMIATGFEANRLKAVSGELSKYRVLHFATHGLINSEQPELSGIILSMVNERGEPEDGFLQLHDIYNLKLSADLVVLSACSTGLGKNIRGEGIIGLTRGFMYAGSKSVVASLWKVEDDATAELMKQFYKALLTDGLTPSAALKRAKVTMWRQERWHAPYYWAAFVLQGEYKETIKAGGGPRSLWGKLALPAGLLVLLVGSFYTIRRVRKKPASRRRELEAHD